MGFLIFISIFTGICLGGYYYILARLFSVFKLKQNLWFWLLLVVLAFGYVVFASLERRFPCRACEWMLRLSAIGLGVGWLCLIVLLGHDLLYLIFRFPVPISRWVVIGVIGCLTLYSFVNAWRIEVKSIDISAPVNMTIVQLSDIHRGSVSENHLRRLIHKTNESNPDVVLITGDLLDPAGRLSAESIEPLNELKAPAYWITGNHERYAGLEEVMAMLKETPVIPLRNEAVEFGDIQLIGIDDSEDRQQVERILPSISFDPNTFTILMYHQPDGYAAAAKAGINLMLSGHTHNGQIWPFNWVVRSRFQYLKGLHTVDGMNLYISTGSGTWGPPMRLGSRNQITLIHLKKND
ncbi:MAG: metallophosphoesterase [Phycisphaerae bacterium]|nr:metallophosphoesterase [Phycisphaerae bacterium]